MFCLHFQKCASLKGFHCINAAQQGLGSAAAFAASADAQLWAMVWLRPDLRQSLPPKDQVQRTRKNVAYEKGGEGGGGRF
jgi:hypothetical protein